MVKIDYLTNMKDDLTSKNYFLLISRGTFARPFMQLTYSPEPTKLPSEFQVQYPHETCSKQMALYKVYGTAVIFHKFQIISDAT